MSRFFVVVTLVLTALVPMSARAEEEVGMFKPYTYSIDILRDGKVIRSLELPEMAKAIFQRLDEFEKQLEEAVPPSGIETERETRELIRALQRQVRRLEVTLALYDLIPPP